MSLSLSLSRHIATWSQWGTRRSDSSDNSDSSDSSDDEAICNYLEFVGVDVPLPYPEALRLRHKQVVRRVSEVLAEALGMKPGEVRRMRRIRFPRWLYRLMGALARLPLPEPQDLDLVEWFNGVESVVAAWQNAGYAAFGYDKRKHELMDLTSDAGFVLALVIHMRLRSSRSMQSFGTVCSSWIWMSRASTKRQKGINI